MATPLTPAAVYGYWRNTKVYWSTDIDDIDDVTREELADSTDLSCEVTGITGWDVTSDVITDAPWGVFASQRLGMVKVDTAQLLVKADLAGQDVRTILSRGAAGWVLILPSGDVEDRPMNVYPVRVASTSQAVQIRGIAYILVNFAVTSRPAENVSIPAETP